MARYDIFVSYAQANEEQVKPLVKILRREGYRVFFDQLELSAGDKWKERLSRAVETSRTLLLCWSKEAAASEYVRYELFRAEGLKRLVLPWLLDRTELPELIEIQGIKEQEPEAVLGNLRSRLSIQLRWWRRLQIAAAMAALAAAFGGYIWAHRPWILRGEVRSAADEAPLEGATVEVKTAANDHYAGVTGKDGQFAIAVPRRGVVLPEPMPATVDVLFRKDGYKTEHEIAVSTSNGYTEMLRPIGQH